MLHSGQRQWHSESGQSLLETAMMMVVIFTITFWLIELGYFTYTYSVLADAAEEGVRYSIVHTAGDVAGTKTTVANFVATAPASASNTISTTVTFPDGGSADPPNRVQVAVTYTYVPFLSTFFNTTTMKTYAEGRRVVK